jgi:hypothetical protein
MNHAKVGEVGFGEVWNSLPSVLWARLTEPFGASQSDVREAKPLKKMVGTRRLELLTSTVSI